MQGNVPLAQASTEEVVLPERVQEALGQLVGSAKEGLLALSVGVGLGVLAELLEEEVVEVAEQVKSGLLSLDAAYEQLLSRRLCSSCTTSTRVGLEPD